MGTSLVAVFSEQSSARQALDALQKGGFSSEQARLTTRESATGGTATQEQGRDDESIGEKIAAFFGFGAQHEAAYSEAVRRGHYVLVVDAADDRQAERACDILERYNPVDIDQQQAEWRQSGWQSPAAACGGETAIPVVEESLQVGKRSIERGGIRVISRMSEKPVEQTVDLREERTTILRRPVDRPVTDVDKAFEGQTVEVRETVEEPVVAKSARVVEEVIVAKETGTRQQTVKGKVRKTEVDVQQGAQKPGRYGGAERRKSTASYNGTERRAA